MEKIGLSPKNRGQSYFRDHDSVAKYPSSWEYQVKYKIKERYARQLVAGKFLKEAEFRMTELGYSKEMLALLPNDLRKAFSGCGCPISKLKLVGNEVLVDLGCGAGIDSFLVSKLLNNGMVVSVDFTFPFLELLERHIQDTPIRIISGDLERLPLANNTADYVISNAAFNLTINKNLAYGEAHRILKPGGQIVMYDLVCDKSLPREVIENPLAHTTSIGGVINTNKIRTALQRAGFVKIKFGDKSKFSFFSRILIKAQKK